MTRSTRTAHQITIAFSNGRPHRRGVARLAIAVTAGIAGAAAAPAWAGDANNVFVYTGPGATAASPVTGNFSNPGSFSPAASNTGTTFGDLNTELQFGGNTSYDASNDIGPFTLNEIQFNGSNPGGITVDGSSANNPFLFTTSNQGSTVLGPQIIVNGSAPVNFMASFNVAAPTSMTTASNLSIGGTGTGVINLSGTVTLNSFGAATTTQVNAANLILSNPGVTNITGTIVTPAGSDVGASTSTQTVVGGIEITAGTVNFIGSSSITPVTSLSNGGSYTLAGENAPNFLVGGPTGTAVVNFNSSSTISVTTPDIGGQYLPGSGNTAGLTNLTTKAACGVVNQSGGTVIYTNASANYSNYLSIGEGYTATGFNGGYGAYLLNGGTLTANGVTQGGGISVGAVGQGVLVATGNSTISTGRPLLIGNYGQGVATFIGNTTFNGASGAIGSTNVTAVGYGTGTGVLNLGTEAGGNATFINQATQAFGGGTGFVIGYSTSGGTVNLDSGLMAFTDGGISRGATTSTAVLNLDGATIQNANSSGAALTLINSSSTYPLSTFMYHGGITVDSQTNTATISANLSSATGTGLNPSGGFLALPLGSGYLAPPLVAITDTSRTIAATASATAIANVSNGAITGITFTNPGMGYTAGDVLKLTFTGGQAGTSSAYYTLTTSYTVVGTTASGTSPADLISNPGGGLTKIGTGTLNLTGTNTYTGTTNISAGVLQPSYESSLPGYNTPGYVTVQSGATLSLTVNTSAPAFTAADISTVGSDVTFVSGSFLGINTANVTAGFNVPAGGIGGGEGLNKLGANTLTLGGTDTYTGPTQVSAGTLQINSSSAVSGTSQINVSNGASFVVNGTTAGLNAGGSAITLNITGNGVGSNGALQGGAAATSTFAGAVNLYTTSNTSGGSIGAGANGTLIVGGTISGSGNLLLTGNSGDNATGSTVILSSVNNYSGETQVNGSANASGSTTVKLGTNNALSTGSDIRFLGTNPGSVTLDLAGYNQSTPYLVSATTSTSSRIANSAIGTTSTLTITNGNGSAFGGSILDHVGSTGGVVAVSLASGSQTFSGTNSYSGGTTVGSGAVLTGGSTTAFGTGPVNLAGGTVVVGGVVQRAPLLTGFNGFSLNSFNTASPNSSGVPYAPYFNSTSNPTAVTLTNQYSYNQTSGQGSSSYSPLETINNTQGFVASFNYQISAGSVGAGDTTFILQNDPRGQAAIGGTGVAAGYSVAAGTTSTYTTLNSLAVELNASTTYSGEIALIQNGTYNTTFATTGSLNISTGDVVGVKLTYNAAAGTLTAQLNDTTANTSFSTVYTGINIANDLGYSNGGVQGYIGFGGGVGGGKTDQTVSNFSFSNLGLGPIPLANPIVAVAGTSSVLQTSVSTGATLQSVGAITINPGATLTLNAVGSGTAPRTVLSTPSVNFTAVTGSTPTSGSLNIGTNDLDITSQSLAAVTAEVAAGYNLTGGGNWQGPGITSSAAANDTTHLTALGVIQNNQGGTAVYTAGNPFDQSTPGAADVLVKYTYLGDANLDGKVDGSDYSLIDAGYASGGTLTGWYYGDFNYDGIIDGSDYALIDNAFNNQTSPEVAGTSALVASDTDLVAGPATAVPEPVTLSIAATALTGLFGRRRGSRKSV